MTHRARLGGIVIDCQTDHVAEAARFWGAALGGDVEIDNATRQVVPRRGAVVLARYTSKTGRRVQFALFDAQHQPIPFGASLEDSAGKQLAISDPGGKALALVEADAGTLIINWQNQRCEAPYALPERNKALNYERVALVCHATASEKSADLQ